MLFKEKNTPFASKQKLNFKYFLNMTYIIVSFFLISAISLRYGAILTENHLPKKKIYSFINQENKLFPRSKVFTVDSNLYSTLWGGKVLITAIKIDGEHIVIPAKSLQPPELNHSHNKIINRIIISKINTKLLGKAAKQLLFFPVSF